MGVSHVVNTVNWDCI